MIRVKTESAYLEDIPDEIKKLLDTTAISNYNYTWLTPKCYRDNPPENFEEWRKTDDFKAKHPVIDSQDLSMQYEKFVDISFRHPDFRWAVAQMFEVEVEPNSVSNTLEMIETHTKLMQKQFEQLAKFSEQTFNDKCNVSITNDFLTQVNQTMLLEDACTDYLQECLSLGWRIISVTPQPNQRRPDYVLGKIVDKPKTAALRGYENWR